jgi:hypothetical protein
MSSRRSVRQLLVAVLLGVLVGGGLMAVTPAGAEVSQSVATSWKKIWKKDLKPLADKRYYTKAQSDTKYATKAESAAGDAASNAATDTKLGSYYKKTESDARYAGAGSSYSKADSDAKYAPTPTVIRGSWSIMDGGNSGAYGSTDINWGYTFSGAVTPHYIPSGGPLPVGCSGTVAAPVASPGHLCVFEYAKANFGTVYIRGVLDNPNNTAAFGANLFSTTTSTTNAYAFGSWAVRGAGIAAGAFVPPSPSIAKDSNGSIVSGD